MDPLSWGAGPLQDRYHPKPNPSPRIPARKQVDPLRLQVAGKDRPQVLRQSPQGLGSQGASRPSR